MSVRMRHTRGHTNNRRSHHALAAIQTAAGESGLVLPHRVDEATGLYRGIQIASPKKAKRRESEKHDHPHGTHHEHVDRHETDEAKPVEAVAAAEETKTAPKKRSSRAAKTDPGE